MKSSRSWLLLVPITAVVAGFALAILAPANQAAPNEAFLTGMVKSASGEKMGGVTVSAKMDGATITTTVFTDEQGNYYFPSLDAGKYRVWAQADTFETSRGEVELGTVKRQDFVMKPMKDYVRQLTGDQLLSSLPDDTPDDRRLKRVFRNNCTSCHQPNYILQNRFDADGWIAIMNLMRNISVTGGYLGEDAGAAANIEYHKKELAAYLARVRGPGESAMKIKVRPRPTGDAARVVFTEYDVPLDPSTGSDTKYVTNDGSDWSLGTPSSLNGAHGVHDAQADLNGNIWYTNNVASKEITLGRVDAKTGEVRYFKVPGGPGGKGNAALGHGITRDQHGIIWFNVNMGGVGPNGVGRLDPANEQIEVFTPPKGMLPVTNVATTIDFDGKGKIWVTAGRGALRFDPDTKQFTEFKSLTYQTSAGEGMTYGLAADREGNGWWEEMNIDVIGKSDIETGKAVEIKIPPVPGQLELTTPEERKVYEMAGSDFNTAVPWAEGPRRMAGDKTGDYVWACDWWGGNLAKIDIHTLKVTIVPLPRPDAQEPYQAVVDKNHNVWTNIMGGDEVLRYDPKTSQWTEFPFPTLGAETRYVSILERGGSTEVILPYSRTRKVARMRLRTREQVQALKMQITQQEQARAQK
jgi:streptogramin lyase